MSRGTVPLSQAVIFNLKDDVVWAHLPDTAFPIALGDYDTVSYMMRDFLAQSELGERLNQGRLTRYQNRASDSTG